jgi:hypothetical protein
VAGAFEYLVQSVHAENPKMTRLAAVEKALSTREGRAVRNAEKRAQGITV